MRHKFPRIIYFIVSFLLIFEQSGFAQVTGELNIAGHLSAFRNSFVQDKFRPLHLRYISYDNLNNNFKLLLDKGDFEKGLSPQGTVPQEKLEASTKILLNYFFTGISLPNDSFWVNLRPDSPDNIIDSYLAQTDLGKILLEADLQLKKDTASFTSPQTPEGKVYWDKLYQKAGELFGSENITIPTLTRPWIVPGEIIIREAAGQGLSPQGAVPGAPSAYIYKATLKVMLEQDYLKDSSVYNFTDPRLKQLNEYSSQLIRETIIPKLTKDVNTSKRYAPLRQVYYSLILAQWFKQRFKGLSPKGTVPGLYVSLIDHRNLTGLTSKESWTKTTYFEAYQKSFKEGEYNIKEQVYSLGAQTIRNYMSGGIAFSGISTAGSPIVSSRAQLPSLKHTSSAVTTSGTLEQPFALGIQKLSSSAIETPESASSSMAENNIMASFGDYSAPIMQFFKEAVSDDAKRRIRKSILFLNRQLEAEKKSLRKVLESENWNITNHEQARRLCIYLFKDRIYDPNGRSGVTRKDAFVFEFDSSLKDSLIFDRENNQIALAFGQIKLKSAPLKRILITKGLDKTTVARDFQSIGINIPVEYLENAGLALGEYTKTSGEYYHVVESSLYRTILENRSLLVVSVQIRTGVLKHRIEQILVDDLAGSDYKEEIKPILDTVAEFISSNREEFVEGAPNGLGLSTEQKVKKIQQPQRRLKVNRAVRALIGELNRLNNTGSIEDKANALNKKHGSTSSPAPASSPLEFINAQIGKLTSNVNTNNIEWKDKTPLSKIPYSVENAQKAKNSIGEIRQVLTELLALVYANVSLRVQSDKVLRAVEVMFDEQGRTLRADVKLYPIHPLQAALNFIKKFGITDPDFIMSAILHDTVEDVPQYTQNPDLIGEQFGKIVQRNVQSVTNKLLPDSQKNSIREFLIQKLQLDTNSPEIEKSLAEVMTVIEYQVGVIREVSENPVTLLLKSVDFSDNALTQKNLASNPKLQSRLSSKYRDLLIIFAEEFETLAKAERAKGAEGNDTLINGLQSNAQIYLAAYRELKEYSGNWEHAVLHDKALVAINDNFGGLRGLAKELEKSTGSPVKTQTASSPVDKQVVTRRNFLKAVGGMIAGAALNQLNPLKALAMSIAEERALLLKEVTSPGPDITKAINEWNKNPEVKTYIQELMRLSEKEGIEGIFGVYHDKAGKVITTTVSKGDYSSVSAPDELKTKDVIVLFHGHPYKILLTEKGELIIEPFPYFSPPDSALSVFSHGNETFMIVLWQTANGDYFATAGKAKQLNEYLSNLFSGARSVLKLFNDDDKRLVLAEAAGCKIFKVSSDGTLLIPTQGEVLKSLKSKKLTLDDIKKANYNDLRVFKALPDGRFELLDWTPDKILKYLKEQDNHTASSPAAASSAVSKPGFKNAIAGISAGAILSAAAMMPGVAQNRAGADDTKEIKADDSLHYAAAKKPISEVKPSIADKQNVKPSISGLKKIPDDDKFISKLEYNLASIGALERNRAYAPTQTLLKGYIQLANNLADKINEAYDLLNYPFDKRYNVIFVSEEKFEGRAIPLDDLSIFVVNLNKFIDRINAQARYEEAQARYEEAKRRGDEVKMQIEEKQMRYEKAKMWDENSKKELAILLAEGTEHLNAKDYNYSPFERDYIASMAKLEAMKELAMPIDNQRIQEIIINAHKGAIAWIEGFSDQNKQKNLKQMEIETIAQNDKGVLKVILGGAKNKRQLLFVFPDGEAVEPKVDMEEADKLTKDWPIVYRAPLILSKSYSSRAIFNDKGELSGVIVGGKPYKVSFSSPDSAIPSTSSPVAGLPVAEWPMVLSDHGLQPINIAHTERDVKAVEYFARKEGLSEEQKEILKVALWLHDITKDKPFEEYIPENKGLAENLRLLVHHLEAAEFADGFLRQQGYDEEFIGQVKRIILTHMGPIEGSMAVDGKKVGFMEWARLTWIENIEKALEKSTINKDRKDKLTRYIAELKKGFPEPKTQLEKIARDIDLLDLGANGVTKIVALRQRGWESFNKEKGRPESIEASLDSAMQSAKDTKDNLETDTAKQIMEGLYARLENLKNYMTKNNQLSYIEQKFSVEGAFSKETLDNRAQEFAKQYNEYVQGHNHPYDGILNGVDASSSVGGVQGKTPRVKPTEDIGFISTNNGDKLYMRRGQEDNIVSVAFYNKAGEQVGFIDIMLRESLMNYIYIDPRFRSYDYHKIILDAILEKLQDQSFAGRKFVFVTAYVQNPLVVNSLLERGFILNPYTPNEQDLMVEVMIPKKEGTEKWARDKIPLYAKDETKRNGLRNALGEKGFEIVDQPIEGATYTVTIYAKYTLYFSDKDIVNQKKSASSAVKDVKGGIDFRALPIVAQPMRALKGQSPSGTVPVITPIPLAELNNEWLQIENMLAAGITPSSERIKEYLQSCVQKQDYAQDIDKVLSCLADILRIEEDQVVSTEAGLKGLLILLESDKPGNEMQLALAKITVEAKEPSSIE